MPGLRQPVAFVRAHDPELATVKRSVLAAVVVPAIFAIARTITSNAQVPLFASFGAFALMLFVSIPGTRQDKLRHYLGLIAAAAVLIVPGRRARQHLPAAGVRAAGERAGTAGRDPRPPRRVGAGGGNGPAGDPAGLGPPLV